MCATSTFQPLTHNIEKWRTITSDKVILSWISDGVKLNFHKVPPPFEIHNRIFSQEHSSFISVEIKQLLNKGCIRVAAAKPHCVSPISVAPKKGKNKYRLIHDLRQLNCYSSCESLVYEDIHHVIDLCEPNDYLVTIDIKDGYHHLNIHEQYRPFLGFKFDNVYYEFCVLPFGLNLSCFAFIKTIRAVLTDIRKHNIRCVSYVDDFCIVDNSESINSSKEFVTQILQDLGFTINIEKSDLTPSNRKTFIGYIIDTAKQKDAIWLEIPKSRIRSVRHDIGRALKKGIISARGLAKITGQLVSMTKAVVPTKLMLRNTYRLLASKNSWSDTLYLDHSSTQDLMWWFDNLQAWNGKFIPITPPDTVQIATDASTIGWGGFIPSTNHKAQGFWDQTMSTQSSNYRELTAVLRSIQSLLPFLKNQKVQILSDNITTCAFINFQGGQASHLDAVARQIWKVVVQNNIQISAKYLRGLDNVTADNLSRFDSHYNWKIHPGLFDYLDRLWGPHDIDRFACYHSSMLSTYNSLYLDTHTSGVDALAQTDWAELNNWVNPPFRLIPKILGILRQFQAEATLIAPWWESKYFHNQMLHMSIAYPIRLPPAYLFCTPLGRKVPEPMKNRRWKIYAWRLSGKTNFYQ